MEYISKLPEFHQENTGHITYTCFSHEFKADILVYIALWSYTSCELELGSAG